MRARFVLFVLFGIWSGSTAGSIAAQTTTGTIRGYVRDQNGQAVSGAQLQARNVETGVLRSGSTGADGAYVLAGVAPGTYELVVRHIGSAPQRHQVAVRIGATLLMDFTLRAGAVELEAVTIQAATPAIETRTSEVATNVTAQQIQQLPSRSRNFLDLAALAPGVIVTEDRTTTTFRTFSAGAQGSNDVNVFIDGASLKNDLTGGGLAGQDASRGNPFPRVAIQEYRVITQNFKAEYQKSSSAIVTATTRSGGNVWSGGAFFGYQDKEFVARDTFQRADPNFKKPEYSRYLAGFSLGGPLIRDRMHMFVSYEGNYQDRANLVNITTLPPVGTMPALDTVNLTNYNENVTSPFRETLLFGKVTYAINNKSSAELSFNNRHETDERDFGGLRSFQSGVNFRNDVGTGILRHRYSTGSWLNEAQVTYQRFRRNPSPITPGIPHRTYQGLGGDVQIGSDLTTQDFIQRRLGLRNDVTYTGWRAGGGDHVIKAGVNVDFLTYDVDKRNRETPQFVYNDTIVRAGETLAYNYRSPHQMIWQSGDPGLKANNTQIGVYLQDDWSPTPRLTLNLGVRWDFETHMLNYDYVTPQDVRDSIRVYYSTLIVPIDTTRYFTDGTQRDKFYGAIQPRLGFSYALDAENKTTVFGGFGIYYDRSHFDISVDETLKLTRPEYTVLFAHPDSVPAANELAWDDSYLTTDPAVLNTLITSGQAAGREVWLIANDTKAPKSTQWNVGIRRLFGGVLVSAAYVGARGTDQLTFNWANLTVNANGGCCVGGAFGHGFSNILFTTEDAKTWYDALQVQVHRPYQRTGNIGWGAGVTYTYSNRELEGVDATDDVFAFPQTTIIKRHPANDEQTRIVANWTVDVPYAFGVQFSGLLTLGSGRLFDVGNRFDLAQFRPRAFSPPVGYIPPIPGGWRYRNVDLRLRKDFPSYSGVTVAVTVDLFNAFNYQNYGSFNLGQGNNPNFGNPTGVLSDPRRVQVGTEVSF